MDMVKKMDVSKHITAFKVHSEGITKSHHVSPHSRNESLLDRSDAQAWLSCHFNVHVRTPSPSFAGINGMLKQNSMQDFSFWEGAQGGQKTVCVFLQYFV